MVDREDSGPSRGEDILRRFFFDRTDLVAGDVHGGKPGPIRVTDEAHLRQLLRSHVVGDAPAVVFVERNGSVLAKKQRVRLGSYCPSPGDSLTNRFCLDIDGGDHKTAVVDAEGALLRVLDLARLHGVNVYAERSKGGESFHVWGFFAVPVPARVARLVAMALVPPDVELAHPTARRRFADGKVGIEVFPKQDVLEPSGVGNMVYLPGFHGDERPRSWWAHVELDEDLRPRVVAADDWPDIETIDGETIGRIPREAKARRKSERARAVAEGRLEFREWKERALAKLPLEAIYGRYLTGRKRSADGTWLEAHDPFASSDMRASAGVATGDGKAERGRFHDFHEGATMDVLEFLQRAEGMSFGSAVARLSELSGIALPAAPARPAPSSAADPKVDPSTGERRSLPQIVLTDQKDRVVLERAIAALREAHREQPQVFDHGGNAVEVLSYPDRPCLPRPIDVATMSAWWVDSSADFVRVTENGASIDSPPQFVARHVLARPADCFPPLEQVARTPTFDRQGRLIARHGYHGESRVFYDEVGGVRLEAPEEPTEADAAEARRLLLDDLLVDFPFATPADRANALAMLVSPIVRPMVGPTPAFLIEAPVTGTGKSMLAKVASALASGEIVETEFPHSEEEMGKVLVSILRRSSAVAILDNVPERRALRPGGFLVVLTSDVYEGRILGESRTSRFPCRTVWILTGNNPIVRADLARRLVRVRLDARMEDPARGRRFRHVLPDYALQRRSEFVSAIVVLVRRWIQSDRPIGEAEHGSAPAWGRILGGILGVAGVEGFLENDSAATEVDDDEREDLASLVKAWALTSGGDFAIPSKLLELAEREELFGGIIGTGDRRKDINRLGVVIRSYRDAVVGEHVIRRAKTGGRRGWRLERR